VEVESVRGVADLDHRMRRSEQPGLQWKDDLEKATLSINRELAWVGYDLHECRGKTPATRVEQSTSTSVPYISLTRRR
jgi:hypothetical protein